MNEEDKSKKVKKKTKKKRCAKCNKKLGIVPFSCKCDNFFCAKCRMPEDHQCTFDWKKSYRDKLEKENPKIEADKVEKC